MSPRGPRPGGEDTRSAIIAAAREEFAAKGYDRTSVRGIARAAGVDPALVHHYFQGKSGLFASVMELPVEPSEVISGVLEAPRDEVGATLVRTFLGVWDTPRFNERLVALIRSAVTYDDASRMIRQFLIREFFGPVVREVRGTDGRTDAHATELAASMVAAQMVGLAMMRYVLVDPAVAKASVDELVDLVAPTIQRYLTA